jgi:nucleoside-triphosphatase THEP1|tara:strand:+ start:18558 stop:19076 length:519 start_codon:yes stop_codon:yes gene_type:complete
MKIAYTMAPGRGDTDQLLFTLAQDLAAEGYRTCGTVQINTDRGGHPCDMDVQVLPDGPVLRISQNLGAEAKGCRLDPAVLETAVGLVEMQLKTAPELLIVNKFGKHEADGRGFRSVIAEAISRDIPVLVGVNSLNLDAFQEFVGPEATELAPSAKVLVSWLQAALRKERDVA